jgi:hypothetical protein
MLKAEGAGAPVEDAEGAPDQSAQGQPAYAESS